jgi:hypothetical protein
MSSDMLDVEKFMETSEDNPFGIYLMCQLKQQGFKNPDLDTILDILFKNADDGSTKRESFVSVLVTIISDKKLLNTFLSQYRGMYSPMKDLPSGSDMTKMNIDRVVMSGLGETSSTHYKSINKETLHEYDSYVENYQIDSSHGFCQVFAIINAIYPVLSTDIQKSVIMNDYDYVLNSYKAMKFSSEILTTDYIQDKIIDRIKYINKNKKKFDLISKINIDDVVKICRLFKLNDIIPTIIYGSTSAAIDYDISKNMLLQYSSYQQNKIKDCSSLDQFQLKGQTSDLKEIRLNSYFLYKQRKIR